MGDERIRELGIEDYERLMTLWERAGLDSLRRHGRDSRQAIAQQLATGIPKIIGLEIDGQLVGGVVTTHDSRKGWINRLVVDADHRRQGYGLRLIEAAERSLRDQGMTVIAALIESDNPNSLAMFQKAGYVEIDSHIHYVSKRNSDAA